MSIVTRQGKGSRLTTQEMDGNFNYLYTASLGGKYEEVVVNINASQINSFPAEYVEGETEYDNAIEILPELPSSQYYVFNSIIVEVLMENENIFTLDPNAYLEFVGYSTQRIPNSAFTNPVNSLFNYLPVSFNQIQGNFLQSVPNYLKLTGIGFSDGTGNMRVIVEYKVRTFGE